jgi:hypothetical protein
MKVYKLILLTGLVIATLKASGQAINAARFFTDEGVIDMTLTTDIRKLQTTKGVDIFQPANIISRFPDSTVIQEDIMVAPRGHFRRDNCNIPPVLVDFSNPTSPRHSSLGKLKLVIGCGSRGNDEQLLIKEYLIYKMYNILEEKSFRVRLVKLNYRDTRNKLRPFSQYAFLIEDDSDLAARTGCVKKPKTQVLTESTDRALMTKVAVFEYMISNGDWSVPNNHNIKVIYDKNNPSALPYAIPYDFDHSGLVNASYALPNEILGTESVTERVYRGFPRRMEELQAVFDVFRSKKDKIYSLVNNCSYLASRTKREVIDYLEEFYRTINDKGAVKSIFIDNARTK